MNEQALNFSDEMLSAFLDDELPPLEMATVRAAIARDSSLGERLAALTLADRLVRQHAQALDQAPLPAAVLALLENSRQAPVTSAKILPWRRLHERPLAVAASIMLVLGLAVFYRSVPAPSSQGTALPDLAQYAAALNQTPSGTAVDLAGTTLLPRFSFRSADGRYCRQYRLATPASATENVACRQQADWALLASVPAVPADSSAFQPASSPATALDAVIDTLLPGPPLDLDTEATLIRQGWQDTAN